MLTLDRHPLGVRVYVLRRRIHEWHVGLVVLAFAAVVALIGRLGLGPPLLIGLIGLWLVAKDWHDLTPTGRDATSWQLGIHRRPLPFRPSRHLDDVPAFAAVGVALVAIVDLVSAVTPNISWRGEVLMRVEPVDVMRGAHALAVPVSFALLVTAYYLYRRRHRALQVALALMAALTVFNVVKGLDVEEAVLTAVAAALLWAGRSSFYVRHEPGRLKSALWRVPLLFTAMFLASVTAVAIAAPASASALDILRGTGDAFLWQRPPFAFAGDELAQTGLAVQLTGLFALLVGAYLLFRPIAAPRDLPDSDLRKRRRRACPGARSGHAVVLQAAHGQALPLQCRPDRVRRLPHRKRRPHDLRRSGRRSERRRAAPARGRRVRGESTGSGSPRSESAPRGARSSNRPASGRSTWATRRSWTATEFSLEGRAIRKVRQSVTRLRKAGYRTEIAELGSLGPDVVARLEDVAKDWLGGVPERGFSMAMDSLRNPVGQDTLVVYAVDEGRHDPRVPPLRADVRARRSVAVVHAPPARDPERPHGVPDCRGDRAPSRRRRDRGVAQLRSVRASPSAAERDRRAGARARSRGRRRVVPDRAALPVQREVLPALGAALLHVRAPVRPGEGRYRRALAGGPAAEAENPAAARAARV